MNKAKSEHQPVLLREVIENFAFKKNGIYIDATFGRGGHAQAILERLGPKGRLLVIDKDLAAIDAARKIQDARLEIAHGSFTELKNITEKLGWIGKVNGILLDLGVSSPQLDEATRGFSFLRDGHLDMRMDTSQKLTAANWLNKVSEAELIKVLREYGEERFSKRIARAIVMERSQEPILTTGRLADLVSRAHPRWEKHKHPATRVFQAIRIFINNELNEIQDCLEQSLKVLAKGGRLLVISFHSLEDRIVKDFIRKNSGLSNALPKEVPLTKEQLPKYLKVVARKVRACNEEIAINPRARSATLRVMEKLS